MRISPTGMKKEQRGAAMMLFIIFFVFASTALTFGFSRSLATDAYTQRSLMTSKQAYLNAEASLEEVLYRIKANVNVPTSPETTLSLWGNVASTTIEYDVADERYTIRSVGVVGEAKRVSVVELVIAPGTAFNYGLQTGNGGFRMRNQAKIFGNAFSNGTVEGHTNSFIGGDVISAGPDGLIDTIHATGTIWSNTVRDVEVDGDAYYNIALGDNEFNGEEFALDPFIDPVLFPLSDEEIDSWQQRILDTGTIEPAGGSNCSGGRWEITDDMPLGNILIECDIDIRGTGGGTIITLTGPVWVRGNIRMRQGPTIRIAPSVGSRSVPFIADNPASRISSSRISVENDTNFDIPDDSPSFVFMISRNHAAANNDETTAIDIGQSSKGNWVAYTNEGSVEFGNSVKLRSVTAYRIFIGNSTEITYDTGLANVHFVGGPGGAYSIARWYQE